MNSTQRLMNQQLLSQNSRRRCQNSTQTELQLKQKSSQLSTSQNLSMEKARRTVLEDAVRGVILVIVFVFDPLAVLLLVEANMSLIEEQTKRRRRRTIRKSREKETQGNRMGKEGQGNQGTGH